MKRLLSMLLFSALSWGTCTTGGSGKCEVGSGKTYATVQACSTAAAAGQTCRIFASSSPYHEIVTSNNGTAGNVITFEADPGASVFVDGFDLSNASYVTIGGTAGRGLSIGYNLTTANKRPLLLNTSRNITISYNTIGGDASHPSGIDDCLHNASGSAKNSNNITVDSNTIQWCGPMGDGTIAYPDTTKHRGNAGMNAEGDYWLVQNNNINHVSDFVEPVNGSYGVVRNNTFGPMTVSTDFGANANGVGGTPSHLDGFQSACATGTSPAQYWLYEGNTITNIVVDAGDSGKGIHGFLAQTDSTCPGDQTNLIVRLNTMVAGSDGILGINNTNSGTNSFLYVNAYGNTVANNSTTNDFALEFDTIAGPYGGLHGSSKNNIFYKSTKTSGTNPSGVYVSTGAATTFACATDLFYSSVVTFILGTVYNSAGKCSNAVLNSDPLFVDSSSATFDGRLQGGSPALQAGSALTTAVSCSGSTMTVANASYFPDPTWGGGITADSVGIGATPLTNTKTISSVNYSTNVITMTAPVTCSAADPVFLYKAAGTTVLFNSLPDIGAYQSGAAAPTATLTRTPSTGAIAPGGTFTLTWTSANATSCTIDNGVGTASPAAGGMTAGITVASGTTTYTLTCTNAGGTSQASVTVTQGGTKQGANTKRGANTKVQ